jgi:small subunit ribosomal protein S9
MYHWGTGRRKEATARVRLARGSGKIVINGEHFEKYFFSEQDRATIMSPLQATKTLGKYDVFASVNGGGKTGQAGAILLGIARALKTAESILEGALREGHFLTRDPRMKERKKYAHRGARRGMQWSKR